MLGGGAVGRHLLTDGLVNDQKVNLLTGFAVLAVAAG